MLTGDKAETSISVGRASRLIDQNQQIFQICGVTSIPEASRLLDRFCISRSKGLAFLVDGISLQLFLDELEKPFIEAILQAYSVICCRCSPTQKALVVQLVRKYKISGNRTCAIGDGGNDVSMIQSADVGIGIF